MSLSLYGDQPLVPPVSTVPEALRALRALSLRPDVILPTDRAHCLTVLDWNCIIHCSQSVSRGWCLQTVVGFGLQRVWKSRVRDEAVKRRFRVTTGLRWGLW